MIKRYLLDEMDKTLAFLGLVLALVLTILLALAIGRLIYITVGVFSFLACAGYFIIKRSLSSSTLPSLVLAEGSIKLYLALNVLFFFLFACGVLSFHLRSDLYCRPLGYFIAIGLMVSVVAVEILFLPSQRWCTHIVLFKIVLIGLSLGFSQLLIFPCIAGVDPWWHQMFTLEILNTGHVPEGYGYSKLPFMHLMIGVTSLITGLDYKIATMSSVSLLQVLCDILFTFLLGRFLFNKKVGLLGGLLLAVANHHVNMSYWAIPNSTAAIFIPAIIYLLLKVRREKARISIFLATLLMGALILTHTVTSVCMAILLLVFWAGFKVYNYMYHESYLTSPKAPVTATIFAFFVVGMFSWWTHASGHIRTLGELIKWGFSVDYFLRGVPEEAIQYAFNVPFSEQLLNNVGMFLFFAISLIGCLYMVSKRFGNSHSFAMAIGGTITLSLGFLALVTGRSIIEHRWWYFSQILLSLPLSLAFLLICSLAKNKSGRSLLLATLTFSLSFLMVLSPLANLDNPIFSPNTQVRYAFTESELQAVETVSSMGSKKIGVDTYYSYLRWSSYPVEGISRQIYDGNYVDCQDMFILIRKEIVENPFMLERACVYKLNYDPRDMLTTQFVSKVYDCGSVSGFIYPESAGAVSQP